MPHNHPTGVSCGHCKVNIDKRDSTLVAVQCYSPITGVDVGKNVVCGICSFLLCEFLCPEINDDAEYIAMKDQLLAYLREMYEGAERV